MTGDPDWKANAVPDPRLVFAQTDPDTGIRFIVKPSPSDAFPGVWLGYVELPAELTEAEIDGLDTMDITGGFDRFIGWIVMEKGEAWTRAECLRVIAQMARLRDAHIARIAAAKAADDAMPWPRWRMEGYSPGSGNGWTAVFLKNKEHFCLASLRRVVQGRSNKIWWHHYPKACGERKVSSFQEGAQALADRGVVPIPPEMLLALEQWKP